MQSNSGRMILLIGVGIVALSFMKLMYDMNSNMARMTDSVGQLSRDVAAMRVSMEGMSQDMAKMGESMQRIDTHIQSMGSAVEQGGKLFKQWDPTQMMR